MSDKVENQIVSMQFDNKQFESGVTTSLGTIDKLTSALQFRNAGAGVDQINRAASRFNLNPMSAAIQGVSKSWIGLTTVAVTAISNITNRAVDAGLRMGKALTLDPIKAGFLNYETKINAVQTILSNTADQGTNLKQVTGVLGQLNEYANLTVYNFSEMAKNIGTFTAAGVDLKTSVSSIKGIANLAALSGSTSEQASSAMYQLSQAIAAGQVHLQDWNSVVNAGIGGAVFQKNLIQAALATGTLDKNQVHLGKTMADTTVNGVAFRQSLTPPPGGTSWLTSGVLTKSLGTFTGDLTKAKLVAQGFTKEQAKAIVAQGKRAVNAATQIKTFSQLFQALKEEVASAWSNVFEALFGNINQAKAFLTPLHNLLQNALTNPINEIADALASWRKAGGFDDLIQIFTNLGTIMGNLLFPFKELFTAILPNASHAGKGLEGFTKTLAAITGWVAKATSVTRKFGVVLKPVQKVFGILGDAAGAFLHALSPLLPVFRQFGNYVSGLFSQGASIAGNLIDGWVSGLNPEALKKAAVDLANSWVTWIKNALGIHSPATTMIPVGENIVQGIMQGIVGAAQFMIQGLQKVFIGIGQAVKFLATNVNWGDVVHVINEALFVAIGLAFRNFLKSFTGTIGAFKETIHKVGGVMDQLTSNLKTMQQKVKSEIIRNIAISVGILAASAFLLSQVNGKKLAVSLGAIAGMMTSLLGVMYALGGGGSKGKHVDGKAVARQTTQLFAMSTALIAFATAVLILTTAVALMGQLKPETIKKGLAGVAGIIGIMVATTAILSKTGGGATILAAATAMTIMAVALVEFVGVMKLYEKLDWKTLVRGGGAAAAVIFSVGVAMRAFGKGALSGSVGLVVASAALLILAKAMQKLAKIGVGDMIKVVVALDYILATLVIAAEGMQAAEGGAGAMLVMAAAIIVLAEALKIVSKIPLLDLAKALGAITLAIIVIAGTSAALSELSPLIAALGTSLLLVGGAMFLAGAGVFLFATAMGILAVVGPAAFAAIADGIDTMIEKLPKIGEAIGGFLVSILTGIVKAAGPLAKAIGKLLGILIDEVIKLIPKVQKLIQRLIDAILNVIAHSYAHASRVMLNFVLNLLTALQNKVPRMVEKGTDLIIAVIKGLGSGAARVVNALGAAILRFLNKLDKAVIKYAPQISESGVRIAFDLVKGLVQGLTSTDAATIIATAVKDLGGSVYHGIRKFFHIDSPSKLIRDDVGKWIPYGLAEGIKAHSHVASDEAKRMGDTAFNALNDTFSKTKRIADNLTDLKPKITPVLDLSQLEKDAGSISSKMGSHTVKAELSRKRASAIAGEEAVRHASGGHETGGDTFNFNQYNTSPKAINRRDVYRGTKSQIALFKEVTKR